MILRTWEELPEGLRLDEVRPYFDLLCKKRGSLILKRVFDVVVSGIMLIVLFPFFLLLSLVIKADSRGPVFYRQERVTQYGRHFRIFKFRTMVNNADKKGTLVTVGHDSRITRVGRLIRKLRLDEVSQLIDVFRGTMTFVGTRPEVPKYVSQYSAEMMATLLLPAGVTSMASIMFKDEEALLEGKEEVDKAYMEDVLPEKMKWNLLEIKQFSLQRDVKIMFMTVLTVLGVKKSEREMQH